VAALKLVRPCRVGAVQHQPFHGVPLRGRIEASSTCRFFKPVNSLPSTEFPAVAALKPGVGGWYSIKFLLAFHGVPLRGRIEA